MARWSISNLFRSVTHKQFIDYTTQFQQAAEQAFGTPCSLEINIMNQPKVFTTLLHKDAQKQDDATNDKNTTLKTNNITDITRDIWKQANFVEVTVSPENDDDAPQSAFATAEYYGKRATFYIQPDESGENVKKSMLSQTSGKIIGDGFEFLHS